MPEINPSQSYFTNGDERDPCASEGSYAESLITYIKLIKLLSINLYLLTFYTRSIFLTVLFSRSLKYKFCNCDQFD